MNKSTVLFVGLEKVWQIFAALLTIKIISGYLGPSDFGLYQIAAAVFVIGTAATWLCPIEAVAGKMNQHKALDQDVFSTSIVIRACCSLTIYTAIGVVSGFLFGFGSRQTAITLIICLSLVHVEPAGIVKFVTEAKGGAAKLAGIRFGTTGVRLLAMHLLMGKPGHEYVMLSLLAAEQLANTLAYIVVHSMRPDEVRFNTGRVSRQVAINFLRIGTRYWIGFVSVYIVLKLDRFFLASRLDTQAFGVYSAGANMLEQVNGLALMLVGVTAPAMIYARRHNEALDQLGRYALAFLLLGLCAAISCYLAAPVLIGLLFGTKYEDAVVVLQALLIVTPLAYLEAATATIIFKFERTQLFILKALTMLLIAAIINLAFYSHLGWKVTVASMGGAFLTGLIFNLVAFSKERRRQS